MNPPSICILALTAVSDDPRVRRQAEAFHKAGWRVTAISLPSPTLSPPGWDVVTPQMLEDWHTTGSSDQAVRPEGVQRLPPRFGEAGRSSLRRAAPRVADSLYTLRRYMRAAFISARPGAAREVFWSLVPGAIDHYRCAHRVDADVWLGNDWTTLPIAARLAAERGGIYGYDTHEFGVEEYSENWRWRLLQRPIVCALEGMFIREAAVVSTVSTGIATRLEQLYSLPKPALTIRNTPNFQEVSFRPTRADHIEVLYHGIVVPNRGLEDAVRSVPLWRPEFVLTIRGPENPDFTPKLRTLIAELGLHDRVRLAPAVPMGELVREARTSDIGFFALPGHSRHNELALPNKFFEYAMAGLALCTTKLPEMARLIADYELGVTIPSIRPEDIAATINGFDPSRIDNFKRNALAAAQELCWERESTRLIHAYEAAVAATRARWRNGTK